MLTRAAVPISSLRVSILACAVAALTSACAATADVDDPVWDEEPSLDRSAILARYTVDRQSGVPLDLLDSALLYYDAHRETLSNRRFLAVIDFARHSSQKRFFVVDLATGQVNGHVVAHGSGSDPNDTGYLQEFSNVPGSNASSDGFFVTAEVYDSDKNGRSLRVDGVSRTNFNFRSRLVVIHGSRYVSEGRSKQGRSEGCFALPEDVKDAVISALAGGSLLFAAKSRLGPR